MKIVKSLTFKYWAVKLITQNKGSKTCGVDGVKSLTPQGKFEMAKGLNINKKTGDAIRRVWIPKPGKTEKRPLGIPTMRERALQMLVKLVIEPVYELKQEEESHGFRPARNCWTALEDVYNKIDGEQYILEGDISKCFDKISHKKLIEEMRENTPRQIIKQIRTWLKAPIKDGETIKRNVEGIPQGGVISPLLANIALNGMRKHLEKSMIDPPNITRYADDFLGMHKKKQKIIQAKNEIQKFLEIRNLKLHEEKTKITHTSKGIEFLGYRISTRKRGNEVKTIIQPSMKKIKQHVMKIKSLMKKQTNPKEAIKELRPIITGWTNYNRKFECNERLKELKNWWSTQTTIWGNWWAEVPNYYELDWVATKPLLSREYSSKGTGGETLQTLHAKEE